MREDATLHLRRYLAPRHWPMWTGLGLLWLGSRLPYGVQMALGRRLGDLSRLLLPARRRVVETNLRLAFPELGPAGRRRLLAEHFRAAGMALFEGALAWWAPQARLQGLLKEVEGEEHLEAAMAAGRGVLLLGGHYTTLEIAGPLVLTLCPVVPTYKPARNPLFEAVMRRARERRFPALLPSRDMRAIIRTLRAGGGGLVCARSGFRTPQCGLRALYGGAGGDSHPHRAPGTDEWRNRDQAVARTAAGRGLPPAFLTPLGGVPER